MDLGGDLAVVRAQDPPGVLQQPSLAGDGRGEEQRIQRWAVKPFPGVRAIAAASRDRPAGLGVSRARAAAWSLAPMPPLRMTGSCPRARRAPAIACSWLVQLVRTRQFLPLDRAAATSAVTWRVRSSLAIRSL